MLPNTFKEGYINTDEDTLVTVKVAVLVGRLGYKLPETEAEMLARTLGNSECRTTNLGTG